MRLTAISEAASRMKLTASPYLPKWMEMAQNYANWLWWYDGIALHQTVGDTDPKPAFPLRINPIKWVCDKHASVLFGDIPPGAMDRPIEFSFKLEDGSSNDVTEKATDVIESLWLRCGAFHALPEAALSAQVCGGAVIKVSWTPALDPPIRIGVVQPEYFMPIWDSSDMNNLIGAAIAYYISPEEALARYGVQVSNNTANILYLEEWYRDYYRVTVDGKVASYPFSPDMKMEGDNPFGFVPFVYIPHPHRAGRFYGTSHVPSLIGLVEELNARMSDVGDKIKSSALNMQWGRDLRSGINIRKAGETIIVDLGPSFPDGKNKPELFPVEASPIESAVTKEYITDVWQMISHDSSIPAVAWGVDEGSQRSAATLEVRFYPLLAHITTERTYWNAGLNAVNSMVLKIMAMKGMIDFDPSPLYPAVNWHSVLPRQRNDLVSEVVARLGSRSMSIMQALEVLSRGEDIQEHYRQIEEDFERFQTKPETPSAPASDGSVRVVNP